jgi:hypothetical protein
MKEPLRTAAHGDAGRCWSSTGPGRRKAAGGHRHSMPSSCRAQQHHISAEISLRYEFIEEAFSWHLLQTHNYLPFCGPKMMLPSNGLRLHEKEGPPFHPSPEPRPSRLGEPMGGLLRGETNEMRRAYEPKFLGYDIYATPANYLRFDPGESLQFWCGSPSFCLKRSRGLP